MQATGSLMQATGSLMQATGSLMQATGSLIANQSILTFPGRIFVNESNSSPTGHNNESNAVLN